MKGNTMLTLEETKTMSDEEMNEHSTRMLKRAAKKILVSTVVAFGAVVAINIAANKICDKIEDED